MNRHAFSMRAVWRPLRRNLTLLAASLGLAMVVWFAITDSENEVLEEPFGFSLAVRADGVPADLLAASRISPVSIVIAGRPDDLERVSVDDFDASVDLSGLEVGSHLIPIQVRSLNDDVRVRSVSPPSVEVVLEPVVQRTLPVTVVVSDSTPIGFERGEPELSPASVVVSGTANLIDLVDSVVAPVDLSAATVDVDLPVTLQARTNTGATVSGIRIEPPTVDVLILIQQELFRRAVAVVPLLNGQPAAGFRVDSIAVEPVSVVVVGTLEALEAITPASTSAIVLTGLDADFVTTASVIAPEGLTLETETTVTVRVQLAAVIGQTILDVPVTPTGVGEDFLAEVLPAEVRIIIEGPIPTLADFTASDLDITVNLAGLGEGLHRLDVRVGFISGIRVLSVTPSGVSVLLSIAEPTPEPDVPDESEPTESTDTP
jgi:YbbR domain-containing protein